jgi:hypothetical protein
MLTQYRPSTKRRLLIVAAAFVSALWLAAQPTPALAQSGRSVIDRNTEARHNDQMREMEMKRLENVKGERADNSPAGRLALEQIGEDFRRMQIVNNELMRATFSGGATSGLDYDRISKASAEINHRAARLRSNLQLPSPAHDADQEITEREIAGEKEMRSSLLSLDKLIMAFVNNPAFRKQDVLDTQHSARASRDLSVIIKLSQKIKQRAEKLKG